MNIAREPSESAVPLQVMSIASPPTDATPSASGVTTVPDTYKVIGIPTPARMPGRLTASLPPVLGTVGAPGTMTAVGDIIY